MKAFIDIDTQIDFVDPGGALYTKGAEKVIPVVARLNNYAVDRAIPLISTMCAHRENAAEFAQWASHCIVGTPGQRKPAATLVADPANQIIVEKDELDVFSNPDFVPLLSRLDIDECYVYGVLTEFCVKCAITGLLNTGRKVWLVTDAIAHHTEETGRKVITDYLASGGRLITSDAVLAGV
jgi:nicotinamidase/pyrazinamidase